ncbi:MAG: sulfite reductase subunit A, partial [Deltaproteobacteria bacterium]|nr:sulfite reductase subunit A [Deltaproteobacteria bacterium]
MSETVHLVKSALDVLIATLRQEGYRVLGPVARDSGVAFEEIRATSDLPIGVRDEQEAGRYRLVSGVPDEIFGVVNGSGSLKPFFFAPEETLLEVRRERRGFNVEEVAAEPSRLAFIGVR